MLKNTQVSDSRAPRVKTVCCRKFLWGTYWRDKTCIEKPQGGRQLGRPRHRWDDNINVHGWVWMTGFIWFRIGISGELL
jgi:hypothetical protein